MKTVVTGLGWVNGAGMGCGREKPFPFENPGIVPRIARKDVFVKPFPHYGRMDNYSRLGLAGIAFALRDAGLEEWGEMRSIGVIASTTFGSLNTDGDYFDTVMSEGGRLASPNLFAYALPNTYLGEASIHFGLTGAVFAVMEANLTGMSGMCITMGSIRSGEHEAVVTGICDAGAPQFLNTANQVSPGALFFVVQDASSAGSFCYGELTQTGSGKLSFDGERFKDLNHLAHMCAGRVHPREEDRRSI